MTSILHPYFKKDAIKFLRKSARNNKTKKEVAFGITLKNIEKIIREEMMRLGGEEVLLSVLQPQANWSQTGRLDAYDTLFKFTSFYSKIDYVLGPTHEEIISPLAKKYIASYRDLPKYLFQIQNKFRDEKRAKAGLLRGREFFMKDLYSFHRDEADLDAYYEKVKEGYGRIFKAVGLGDTTYLTVASGGTFSKYSHEFQTLTLSGEDAIYICEKCHVAVNQEIIKEQSSCPECGNTKLREEKAVEVGNIFKLMAKFSRPFNLTYKDENGSEHDVLMACFGIGLNRLMGTIVEVHHDEKGIIWPESVAPFRLHMLELPGGQKIYEKLIDRGVEVLYDDRDLSAGEKFADADLIGIPWRAIVSEKTGDKIELKRRGANDTVLVTLEELIKI
ncbi:MAG: aminoacyl--tRNA ligase-related protein, partial [bacterium]|nr:aminoacyl--tRNA ligase-related protein [bacterium]